jgi:hypothetical protein
MKKREFCRSLSEIRHMILTCRKILRRGASGFASRSKEGVLRIFIAVKNPSPWPGVNPRLLGSVASTLTSTPPKRTTFVRVS